MIFFPLFCEGMSETHLAIGDRVVIVQPERRFETTSIFREEVKKVSQGKDFCWCNSEITERTAGNVVCIFTHPYRADRTLVVIVALDHAGLVALTDSSVRKKVFRGMDCQLQLKQSVELCKWRSTATDAFPDLPENMYRAANTLPFNCVGVCSQVQIHPHYSVGQFVWLVTVPLQPGISTECFTLVHAVDLKNSKAAFSVKRTFENRPEAKLGTRYECKGFGSETFNCCTRVSSNYYSRVLSVVPTQHIKKLYGATVGSRDDLGVEI